MDSSGDAEQGADNGASLIQRLNVIADIAETAKQHMRICLDATGGTQKDLSDSISGVRKNAISAVYQEAKKADTIIDNACKLAETSITNSAKIAIHNMHPYPNGSRSGINAPQQIEVGLERARHCELDLLVMRRDGTAPFFSELYTNSMTGLTEGGLHEFPPVPNLRAFLHDWATHNDPCHIMIHQGNGTSSIAKQFIDEVRRADFFSASFPQKGSTAYKKNVLAEFTAVVNLILDLFTEEHMPPSLHTLTYTRPLTNPIVKFEFLFDYDV